MRETFSKLDHASQETQTAESNGADQLIKVKSDLQEQQSKINELNMKLDVKEKFIDSIKDEIVLKEAEITRLKSRIIILERKSVNDDDDEVDVVDE